MHLHYIQIIPTATSVMQLCSATVTCPLMTDAYDLLHGAWETLQLAAMLLLGLQRCVVICGLRLILDRWPRKIDNIILSGRKSVCQNDCNTVLVASTTPLGTAAFNGIVMVHQRLKGLSKR